MQKIIGGILVLFVLVACHKGVPEGNMKNGQVALTFDDASIDNWYDNLRLLDSLKIKATFYICNYHTLSKQQKERLKEMERRGHEIAYHTTTHADLAKEVARNGLAQTEEKEILQDLYKMRADGFKVENFAYPYGSHTAQLNTCLLRTFKSVRALSNKQNYYKSLVGETGEKNVLYGANADNNSRLKDDKIISLMNDAKDHHDCLVLVAHQINNPALALQISKQRLQLIAQNAKEKGLRFVTVSEIVK